jgi:uncharacterized protein HemY
LKAHVENLAKQLQGNQLQESEVKGSNFPVMDSQENDTTTDELTTQVKNLSNKLRESEVEGSSVIIQWQELYARLDAQLEILKKENEDLLTIQVEKLTSQLQESNAEGVETSRIVRWS